ncbi:autotransporter-associated beta strand repeat-containing protein [Bacillus sp. AFS088145]|uniref:autotransporter-associated beta strand repeat-containing protein n=1 Tax=Bacillus sp. AFS088145 TaxID=2033514 RepID=UPI0025710201|nr:autotransporter-associated beta strand repeat-containing protein [Bacillus sp. AFS088145]
MHSPLAVMGGRMTATALAAATLNDPANANIEANAYQQAQSILMTPANATSSDLYSDYKKSRENYINRLTYGFSQTGDKTKPMVVPKGAEVLLKTRFPYLDETQRRWVLYSTGIQSGYPLLDDSEGWGRLDLFSAVNGYGAFNQNVTVDMDASHGGFEKQDEWKNDITGVGSLTKEGTGQLDLQGNNTYTGGTLILGGTLEADNEYAFGTGNVRNYGGTINVNAKGGLEIEGNFNQIQNSLTNLNMDSQSDILNISGRANLDGTLTINLTNGYIPTDGAVIAKYYHLASGSKFDEVVVKGLPSGYKTMTIYKNDQLLLKIIKPNKQTTK